MVQADGLVKIYKTKETEVLALQGLDLTVNRGELTALIGNSGSGKSTFLNMIGGLDRPSAGSLKVDGKNLFTMTEKELVLYKRDTVGFVWQNNGRNMLPYLTAIENIMLPMNLGNVKNKKDKAYELLDMVGLSAKKHSKMNMLSGGEQQRIAIAIALANSPKLLLADEPTGSVDSKTADYIFDIFTELNKKGQTILIVTHDTALSKKVKRVVAIRDGKISSERVLKEQYADRVRESSIDWRSEDTQDEYAVLDKANRLQIPSEFIDEMGLSDNKVRIEYKDDKILISKP
ncbi:MAG: ABC transporter ATP-binding protein [Lachnospiraceae bacterium]|nr:ABC transporter ATP-binding protein [Lachnospiraceae bacterium]